MHEPEEMYTVYNVTSLDDLTFCRARRRHDTGETVTRDCTHFPWMVFGRKTAGYIDQGHCLLDGFEHERKFPVATTARIQPVGVHRTNTRGQEAPP